MGRHIFISLERPCFMETWLNVWERKKVHMAKTGDYEVDTEEAVRTYADMVYRLACLNTNNKETAEDVFQTVFLKLVQYKESIISEEHLKAWLIRVTINQCKSVATSSWNRKRASYEDAMLMEEPTEQEDFSDVYEAVRELPEKYRQVIHLFYYEQLAVKDIAGILDTKEATVKTWLARGRKLLNEKLKEEYGNGRI